MIQKFVDAFIAAKSDIETGLRDEHPRDYEDLVKRVVKIISKTDSYASPDPERITVIDHGDYQGTKLFIISEKGFQPSRYWAIFVSYGSCSGCDTFEAIGADGSDPPTEKQVNEYWTLMLHMIQGMRQIGGYEE